MTDAHEPASSIQPVTTTERNPILDVLRGFALFGVLVANLNQLGGEGILATADQLGALASASQDAVAQWFVDLLIMDKANTLFAFLFGFGFWVQMERITIRGGKFHLIYMRRITLLTSIGFLHLWGWFAWDILHLYGLAAVSLFFLHRIPDRWVLIIGVGLLILGRPGIMGISHLLGIAGPPLEIAYSEEAVLTRQVAAHSGDLGAWLSAMNEHVRLDWFASGTFCAWFLYVVGRFYLGAWTARRAWLQYSHAYLPDFGSLIIPCFFFGFTLQYFAQVIGAWPETRLSAFAPVFEALAHAVATPLIAAGYVCTLVMLFNHKSTQWLVKPFAPVGQMALTNYLMQSVFIVFILTGIGPGLALAGKVGTYEYVLFSLAVFSAQILFSQFWLSRYAHGPVEWLWRVLTYGGSPSLKKAPSTS
ncbi:MAG: DUF418 domain-containing protein [Pseudomonadota bacterium]